MIRMIIWLIAAAICLIIFLPVCLLLKFSRDPDKTTEVPALAQFNVDWASKAFTWLAGGRPHAKGLENVPEGGALFVGNHQGDFDIALVLRFIKPARGFIAKKETSKLPIVRIWLRALGCIYIDRKSIRSSLETMKKAEDYLRRGRSLVVFPEGTRSRGPEMGEFKSGALKCAMNAGVPIVPFAIDNSYKLFEENGYFKPTDMIISVLKPIYPEEMPEKTQELAEEIKHRIQCELDELRKVQK